MKRAAFSLIELSIVLVILGLLVGGVLAGRSLIHASELKHDINTLQQYQTATLGFRDKYLGLPGDLLNAQSFWPACTGTCNGNGNGMIRPLPDPNDEPARVFEHLSRAGLISGSYNGDPSLNLPSHPEVGKFGLVYLDYRADLGLYPDHWTRHVLSIPIDDSPKIISEDVYYLDGKIDDGNGYTGIFRVVPDELPSDGCIDLNDGKYLIANPADFCSIYYLMSF
jgi:prepilin-type N-terminal cleavage/methylation domain-containing protein